MAARSQTERAKAQQEKFQAILSAQLRDEDNKFCVDCDAKGPRWASWNLGVFLCIRCAGIHRNLGVHISRVKSVNLDSWTPEQVAMMQEMGNSRARAVYEANVSDNFHRPQSTSELETFIRAKYETKKYIAREWIPPKPVVPKEWFEDDKADKKKIRSRPTTITHSDSTSSQTTMSSTSPTTNRPKPTAAVASQPRLSHPQPQAPKVSSPNTDLLGLDAEIPQKSGSGGQGDDLLDTLFGGFMSASDSQGADNMQNSATVQQNGSAESNLFDNAVTEGQGEKKSAKDSIMALYGSGGAQQPVYAVPGMLPMNMNKSQGIGTAQLPVSTWINNPFLYAEGGSSQTYFSPSTPYSYSGSGGMYMPQQQMYSAGMVPMMQQQPMMGMQPGMMGQPVQQGVMGMQQQPGMMFGSMGPMGGNMMAGAQGGMMGMPSNQMYMQQQGMGQMNPMQQQMQFQQMQQQMANMTVGGQMGGLQQPQQTTVGGNVWGGMGSGQSLSNNLWQ